MMDPSLAKNQSLEIEQLLAFLEEGLKRRKSNLNNSVLMPSCTIFLGIFPNNQRPNSLMNG